MKTDLAKILTASGQSGLFLYISATRTGAVVEALQTGKRTAFTAANRITSLADISIYTDEGEMKLQDVFEAMHKALGEEDAPTSKATPEAIKAVFEKAVPNYDGTRFYVSHMKKVVDWYNCLKNYASLDFLTDEEREAQMKDQQ